MNIEELRSVRESVARRLSVGEEPPWSWFTLMKLQEALDETIAGMECVYEGPKLIDDIPPARVVKTTLPI